MAKIKTALIEPRLDMGLMDDRGMTAERIKKLNSDEIERGDTGITYLRNAPLERIHARKVITDGQYEAGSKLKRHWHYSGLQAQLASPDLGKVFATDVSNFSGLAKTEQQLFHRQRLHNAREAIKDKAYLVLTDFICDELRLEDIGMKRLNWKNRVQAIAATIEVIRHALDQLCDLWGIDKFQRADQSRDRHR